MEILKKPHIHKTTPVVAKTVEKEPSVGPGLAPGRTEEAPIPSGADIARQRPALPDLPVIDLVEARKQPFHTFPDGVKFIAARLQEIEKIAKHPRVPLPVTVVFDLDNTVFDTRWRTLHALQKYDEANGTEHFKGCTVGDMKVDGHSTAVALAEKLGLPPDVIEGAGKFWETSFWTPSNLVEDQPIAAMIQLIKDAQDAGAQVKFLTGRTQPFHQASLDQLRKAGIVLNDDDVVCKPDVQTKTAEFKEIHLKAWSDKSVMGFFVTEGVRDLEHMHSFLPDVPLLRLDCSFEDGKKLSKVPLYPGVW